MKKILLYVSASIVLSLLTGCFSAPGGISPSTMPITSKDSYTIVKRDATGSDIAFYLLGIPLGPTASAYRALQDAKEEYNADALINVTGENKFATLLFLFYTERITINGDAIKFQRQGEDI